MELWKSLPYLQYLKYEYNAKINKPKIKLKPARFSKKGRQQVKASYKAYTKNIESVSMNWEQQNINEYLLREHYIDKVELKNVKVFKQLNIDFTTSNDTNGAPWMMLLGENGTGKSTVLKSIALNLSDGDYLQNLIREDLFEPDRFIRHKTKKATIKVWLTGMTKPRILEIRKELISFTSPSGDKTKIILPLDPVNSVTKNWDAQTFLLGYGATRLLPRGGSTNIKLVEKKYIKFDNLFNPFVPLTDAEDWLLGLDRIPFRRAAIVLKDLLNMSRGEDLISKQGEVLAKINGTQVPFHELSDGYQSVVALTIDILQ